ncbi:unnamed protein product [Lactuca saligna]|uniref:Uncharacterized protein n=1 Tax=Lactuca saligna TaxID=75948 RepID=A0AA35ZRB7_LACSI|nr:unnamed protein product [Lactuca saligna]
MKTTIDWLPILTLSRDRSRGWGNSVCSSDDVSLSLPTSSIERWVARSLLREGVFGLMAVFFPCHSMCSYKFILQITVSNRSLILYQKHGSNSLLANLYQKLGGIGKDGGTYKKPTKGLVAQRYQVVPLLFEVEGSSLVVDIGGIGVVSLEVHKICRVRYIMYRRRRRWRYLIRGGAGGRSLRREEARGVGGDRDGLKITNLDLNVKNSEEGSRTTTIERGEGILSEAIMLPVVVVLVGVMQAFEFIISDS